MFKEDLQDPGGRAHVRLSLLFYSSKVPTLGLLSFLSKVTLPTSIICQRAASCKIPFFYISFAFVPHIRAD